MQYRVRTTTRDSVVIYFNKPPRNLELPGTNVPTENIFFNDTVAI